MTLTLIRQIAVLFMMMACGFALVRCKLLRSVDSRSLSVMLIYIVQPCVVIRAFQLEFTPSVRRGFLLATLTAILIHLLLLALNRVVRRVARLEPIEQASIIYSNAGNLVIPLVMSVLGEEWVIYASAFLCVQQFMIWTHGVSLIHGTKALNWRSILLNCNLIAIALGVTLMLTGIRLPPLVMNAMSNLSAVLGPVSMIMIGMVLAGQNLPRLLVNRRLWLVSGLKMLLIPGLVLLFLAASHLYDRVDVGRTVVYITFMAVMTPPASMVTQLAQVYGRQPEYASAINALSTLLCIATMPLMTWLYNALI